MRKRIPIIIYYYEIKKNLFSNIGVEDLVKWLKSALGFKYVQTSIL